MRKRPIVKAIFCIMVSLLTYGSLKAAHLTPEEALQRLEKTTSMKKVPGIKPELCHTQRIDGEDCLYVFNKGDRGYVIASADDRMPPVFGYSDNGKFDSDKMPPALKCLLEQYAVSSRLVRKHNLTIKRAPSTRSARNEIEPLIQTHWGQGEPYNDYCPEIDGERCAPGSAATAMAQIINYHRYPEKASGFHGYEWNDQFLSCNFDERWIDYDEIMDYSYSGQMPWLIYACAISVETDFNPPFYYESEVDETKIPYYIESKVDETKIPYAFTSFFDYDPGIKLIYREMVSSNQEWEDIIYSELEAGRPVLYGCRENNYGVGYGGFFVCDGFREESFESFGVVYSSTMIHLNLGDEEYLDGYFDLEWMDFIYDYFIESGEIVIPFNYNHSIVCGIQPPTDRERLLNPIYAIGGIQEVVNEYDDNWQSCLRLSFDGGIFSYKPSNYELPWDWEEWYKPEEVTFYIKSVSENGKEYISERGTPIMFYPNDEETLMRGYNEIGPLYPPRYLPEGLYKSYLVYQTRDGEMHDLMFRSNGPRNFITDIGWNIYYNRDYEYDSMWLNPYNPDDPYFSKYGLFPENIVISGLPAQFHYSFFNKDGWYDGFVYVRVFELSGTNHSDPIYPEYNYCSGYDLKKEDVFMLRGNNYYEGSIELTYDLAPGEYELICYDQNGDRMAPPLPLIIEPEEGSYQLEYSMVLENPESWNFSDDHVFNIEGIYSSPTGMDGHIEYSVDYREYYGEWMPLTDFLYEGDPFQSTIYAWFEPGLKVHSINFRIVDVEGNIILVKPMKFPDINYIQLNPIEEYVYNGEPHFPNVTSPDVESDGFTITDYYDNVNAGTACFELVGVYPKTIGVRNCEFKIRPAEIQGTITLAKTEFDFTGKYIYPAYELDGPITGLKKGEPYDYKYDYEIKYDDNLYAGKAYVRAQGRGNYTGSIMAPFTINMIDCPEEWISYKMPDADITFDGEPHEAVGYSKTGMGRAILSYECDGVSSNDAPVNPGDYEVYLQYKKGYGVNEVPIRKIGQFSIYELNDDDWGTLLSLNEELSKANEMDSIWYVPLTDSKASAGKLNNHGLKIERGAIKNLNLSKKGLKGDLPISAFGFKNIEELSLDGNQLTGKLDRLSALLDSAGTSNNLRKLALNDNLLEGNAGVLASLPNLEWLAIDDNCISDIIPMIGHDVTLTYKNQNIKEEVTFDLRDLDSVTLDSGIPSIALYDHSKQRYTFEGRNIDLSDDKDWNIHLRFNNGQMTKTSSTEDVFTGGPGELLDAEISPLNCKARVALRFHPGDVDFNSYVNILDIQSMINHIFERRLHIGYDGYRWYDPFNHTAANLFEDEIINVQDAVRLVDIIMESDPVESKDMRKAAKPSENTEAEASVYIDNGYILLSSVKGVAAFDIIIEDPDISLISLPGFSVTKRVSDGKTRIIGYSLSGETLPEGNVRLGYSGAQDIKYAMLSDVEARELSVALNEHATGVSTIETADFIDINGDHINLSIPAGSNATWQITTVNGLTLHKGSATVEHEGIEIPFKGEAGSVYIISVNYGGKQIHKKIIKN